MSGQTIPNASTIILSSGNILNWNSLKRKVPKSSTEEIKFCLKQTLKCCLDQTCDQPCDSSCLQQDVITLTHPQNRSSQQKAAREEIKVTVKLMITKTDEEEITEALDMVLKELEIDKIDVLLLALSKTPNVIEDSVSFEHLKPLWWELEREVNKGRIGTLGICDADKTMLEKLHQWARVKPIIDQLNQDTCCVIPPDLNEYAKANKIQLLTHNDKSDVLPPEDFQAVLGEFFPGADSEQWYPAWTLRFTVLIRCRGVITTKGYILKALKDRD
ncbi:glutamate--cysteine ligase regulatory subunit [Strongylocentrotus purpuratus]|uniref:GCS light chain n=1 Tax=Strongylocentrotus purpuratus TaxID=7668 RepID=A0A7M7LPH2_STRPU|nr:glutamate--cysteine ligase regulatory subunit [Strongylocentrotus purpuratus]|eukprot:XP_003727682.1 PREDICTED: glutamate--cysteine ligase regulatory subunit [Strongylocentrotus purpuratus]